MTNRIKKWSKSDPANTLAGWAAIIMGDISEDYERENDSMAPMSLAALLLTKRVGSREERIKLGAKYPHLAHATVDEIVGALNNVNARDVEAMLAGATNGAVAETEETPAPKRRGRPPGSGKKAEPVKATKRAAEVEDDEEEEETPTVRRRGRPPGSKNKSAAAPVKARKSAPVEDDEDEEEAPAPKRRGRPPGSGKVAKPAAKKTNKKRPADDEDDDDEIENEIDSLAVDEDEEDEDDSEDESDDEDDDDD